MASLKPLELRWGIIATGRISRDFVLDLLVDPKTRDVHDVSHKVTAVGSRSTEKAQEFIDQYVKDGAVKAYGSYEGVYDDPNVDAIYIGTPHTHHYTNARDGILAGKHVLCEKPVTCNAAELKSLVALAQERKVFFMEALWTRFQPLTREVRRIADSGVLGEPVLMHADLAFDADIENIPKTHRMLDPQLGGGALLDLGPYPTIWAIVGLYEHPSNKLAQPSAVTAAMVKTPITGVDSATSWTVSFSNGDFAAHANLSVSMVIPSNEPGVTIRYRKGVIKVASPIFCPKSFTVQYFNEKGKVYKEETRVYEYVGSGWHFQADEVARCVRDGKLQSDLWGWDKSILEMTVFDEVRRQGGYVLPPGVEKVQ
ncbi:NAD P-binding protein [Gloeophyllum trabeum ATCC 11539]|uniref:D-xylose 1-dehydrogenase (NADP(+), D-xylono-1,5-lactone-forming) n=1 Tax=Gloeophyllum trabeum (strain ATCC 11539 / FP-39264 / Madison 617) TaxID=670483 RepID=S7QAP7_GLOTA|nr:NAD P-binding protein [Gloeophyllum trabeum ATCC 11539]EPQ56468.1 NAD P-binding protein [Gloeophyllum trabeum ATCC 11539]